MPDDDLLSGSEAWYGGVAPTDVGNLDGIREERQVIPPTKGVKLLITKAEATDNKEHTYRQISLVVVVVDGIDETGKYKGKPLFARICYYADPNVYTKEWFTKKQHLIQLKYLKRAIGWESNTVDGHFIDACLNKLVLADITIKKRKVMLDDGQGGKEEVEIQENDVRNFKALPTNQQI